MVFIETVQAMLWVQHPFSEVLGTRGVSHFRVRYLDICNELSCRWGPCLNVKFLCNVYYGLYILSKGNFFF